MKVLISSLLRKAGLLYFSDKLRYCYFYCKTHKSRKEFKTKHPNVSLPPNYLVYESYRLDYHKYYYDGKEAASWLINHLSKHIDCKGKKILDWGCGPARMVRHLPYLLDPSCKIYGTDYNNKSIEWNIKHIPNIDFRTNELAPPLDFTDNMFDVVYGISIFTHLSEKYHYLWANELMRVLKPGGLLFVTTHGNAFYHKLTSLEQKTFKEGQIVEKANTKEGHRTFAAFQPISFFKKVIANQEIMEYIEGKVINGFPEQDIWIIRKR